MTVSRTLLLFERAKIKSQLLAKIMFFVLGNLGTELKCSCAPCAMHSGSGGALFQYFHGWCYVGHPEIT